MASPRHDVTDRLDVTVAPGGTQAPSRTSNHTAGARDGRAAATCHLL